VRLLICEQNYPSGRAESPHHQQQQIPGDLPWLTQGANDLAHLIESFQMKDTSFQFSLRRRFAFTICPHLIPISES
jgi:hypothetical protein